MRRKKNNLVFFLGGQDAEMVEIKNILQVHQLSFVDKGLRWGARASHYMGELRTIGAETPVLIELETDIDLPENSIIIDHHNSKAGQNQPTSIEQVGDLLGIKLNRWQQLIAANDRGWIPGLMEAGASREEIEQIRKFDRACQGVTEKMEVEAESICAKITKTNRPVSLITTMILPARLPTGCLVLQKIL